MTFGVESIWPRPYVRWARMRKIFTQPFTSASRSEHQTTTQTPAFRQVAETLTWAARGITSAEIAQIMGLAKRTIDFHIDNARIKLDVARRIEGAIKAAKGRPIDP
jgi:DNA-binding CsgD family transcriptional regulator